MRILQLISSSGLYGAERVLLELACFLDAQGHQCQVGALQAPGQRQVAVVDEARDRGLPVVLFPGAGKLDPRVPLRLRRHVRSHGVELVHSHGYKSDIALYLARLQPQTALVSTCHNWLTDSLKLMAFELLDKLVLQHFDHVVAVSERLDVELAGAGIDPARRSVIQNGLHGGDDIDPADRQRLRQELGVGPRQPLLISVGRLDPFKAHEVLLQALALASKKLPEPPLLLLVGEGELLPRLRSQARELGLEQQVLFTGYRRDVPRLLRACDLFVLPSLKEGLPMVLLEAMAARVPAVCSAVGSIPAVLEQGQGGVLVPPEDAGALARQLVSLLSDGQQARKLAGRAHDKFLRDHSREAMGRRYLKLYRGLLTGAEPGRAEAR